MSPPNHDDRILSDAVLRSAAVALSYGQRAVDHVLQVASVFVAAEPKVRDPRIKQLIGATKRELNVTPHHFAVLLSPNAHPASGGKAVNESPIKEYRNLQGELREYLDAAAHGLVKGEGVILDSWSETLFLTGDFRMQLANNLSVHFRELLADERTVLKQLKSDLTEISGSLDRVYQAMMQAKKAKDLLSTLLTVKDAAEAIQSVAEAVITGSTAVVGVTLSLIAVQSTIDNGSQSIKSGFGKLAQYSVDLSLAKEEYGSVEEIQNSLTSTIDAIRDSIAKIKMYIGEISEAKVLYTIPVAGERMK